MTFKLEMSREKSPERLVRKDVAPTSAPAPREDGRRGGPSFSPTVPAVLEQTGGFVQKDLQESRERPECSI